MGTSFCIAVVLVVCGCIVLLSWTKKGYLSELEKALNLKNFQLGGFLGDAKLKATWKDVPFTIEAKPQFSLKPAPIKYSMEYNFGYIATITPGPGLNRSSAAVKKSGEEDTARPWRVKLTEEEQKIIDSRRGGAETEATLDKFNVVANQTDGISRFLKDEKHAEAVEALLKAGITSVRIDVDKVEAVKTGYSNSDMMPKQVEKYLTELKKLVS